MKYKEAMVKCDTAKSLMDEVKSLERHWSIGPNSEVNVTVFVRPDYGLELMLDVAFYNGKATADMLEKALKCRKVYDSWINGKIDDLPLVAVANK